MKLISSVLFEKLFIVSCKHLLKNVLKKKLNFNKVLYKLNELMKLCADGQFVGAIVK
jgi:hypothetical protein